MTTPARQTDPAVRYLAKNAALLDERTPSDASPSPDALGAAREWQESAFLGDDLFAARLSRGGYSAGRFARLVSGQPFSVAREATEWAEELDRVLSSAAPEPAFEVTVRLYGQEFGRVPFDGLLNRFAAHFRAVLEDEIAELRLAEGAVDSLVRNLLGDLIMIGHRTLITRLHAARTEGLLEGGTPEERYAFFNDRLLRDEDYTTGLFAEYPLLGRRLVRSARNWVAYSAELLRRLAADAPELHRQGLLASPDARVADVSAGLGDQHYGGRSVARLTFEGGGAPSTSRAPSTRTASTSGPSPG